MCRQFFQECLLLMGTECGQAVWWDSRVKKEYILEIVNANSSLYAVKNYLVEVLLAKQGILAPLRIQIKKVGEKFCRKRHVLK